MILYQIQLIHDHVSYGPNWYDREKIYGNGKKGFILFIYFYFYCLAKGVYLKAPLVTMATNKHGEKTM